jgi:hypothetical protein
MIISEGLGTEFIGKTYTVAFTPYLDSLIPKSLYWENFVSNAGVLLSVAIYNLVHCRMAKRLLELNPLPANISLVSILKANDYTTSFYSETTLVLIENKF